MGVSIDDVFNTLQVYLGLALRQRLQPLRPHLAGQRPGRRRLPQADRRPQAAARSATTTGGMVPLGAVASGPRRQRPGDDHALQHVSRRPPINGDAGPGRQLRPGDRRPMEAVADDELPPSMRAEWTELALLQLQTGNTAMLRLRAGGGAGVPGAGRPVRKLVAAAGGDPGRADVPALLDRRRGGRRSMDINIFTQIGFVVLVGLACKNAILIVEFAKAAARGGRRRVARRRWKPASCGCGRS